MSRVGEDDIRYRQKGLVERIVDDYIDFSISGAFCTDSNHGDHDCSKDGYEGCNGQVRNIAQFSRYGADEADDGAYKGKDNSTGGVNSNSVHHNAESKDMRTHYKDKKEDLSSTEDFSANGTKHYLTGIGHVVYMRIRQFELPNDETCVSC